MRIDYEMEVGRLTESPSHLLQSTPARLYDEVIAINETRSGVRRSSTMHMHIATSRPRHSRTSVHTLPKEDSLDSPSLRRPSDSLSQSRQSEDQAITTGRTSFVALEKTELRRSVILDRPLCAEVPQPVASVQSADSSPSLSVARDLRYDL